VQKWPRHRKVAVGVWIPVVFVAMVLYTGPTRAARPAAAPVPTTTATTSPPPPTRPTVPPNVPENALVVGALPEITPRMPKGMSDQLRVALKRASRERTAQIRNIVPVLREWTRDNMARARPRLAAQRTQKLKNHVATVLRRRTLR
jgi:hypothetical protein